MRGMTLALAGFLAAAAPTLAQTPKVAPVLPAKVKAFAGSLPLARVENALRLRQELSLTEQQITQLDALRKEEVTRMLETNQTLADLESRVRAGLADREALRAAMQSRMDAQRPAATEDRLNSILTAEQRTKLDEAFPRPFFKKGDGLLQKGVMPNGKLMRPLLMKRIGPATPKLLPLRRRVI